MKAPPHTRRTRTWSRALVGLGLVSCGLAGCSDDGSSGSDTIYSRLGKSEGIQAVVHDFLAAVDADPKINGYFLNSSVNQSRLEGCLVKQVAEAAGGPEKYDCASMKDAHQGMSISKTDFDDLVGHFAAALTKAKAEQKDIDALLAVLGPMATDIVEDPANDGTIYQRVGRKPAIAAVVTDFHGRVMADPAINGFFATTNAERLATCLVRQVCEATGGPCKYGDEGDGIEGLKSACRDMRTSHASLGISIADFNVLVGHLVDALDAAGVPNVDRDAIVAALGPLCPDIVESGACP